jgi:hypothetical protein
MELTYKVNEWTGCRIKLTSRWKGRLVERQRVSDADLSLLSPQVEIQDDSTTLLTGVMAHTTSGQPDIPVQVIHGSGPKMRQAGTLAFMLSDRAFARTLARHLADAVTACGGQPRDEAATSLGAARRDSVTAEIRAREMPTEEQAQAISACQLSIRKKLQNPESARFAERSSAWRSSSDTSFASVLGKVQDGAVDKPVEKNYMCTMRKRGDQYVSANAGLH